MTAYYIIDNQDLSKVTYTGKKWVQGGSSHEYNETVISSTNVGDFFSVSFRGESIAVFGTFDINSGGVETTYSIDGAPPVTAISQSGSRDTFGQQFWRSNTLELGDHTLLVNLTKLNVDYSQPGEGTVWFDYFLVTDPTMPRTSSSNLPDPSQPATIEPQGNVSRHAGLIVGAVIGGLFFLLGVAFLFLLFRRKTRQLTLEDRLAESPLSPDRRAGMIQPFMLTLPDTQAQADRDGGTSMPIINPETRPGPWITVSGPTISTASRKSLITTRHSPYPSISSASTVILPSPDDPLQSSSSTDIHSAHHHHRDASTDRDRIHRGRHLQVDVNTAHQVSPATSTGILELPPGPVRHVDSGIRTTNEGRDEPLAVGVELPPVYSPS